MSKTSVIVIIVIIAALAVSYFVVNEPQQTPNDDQPLYTYELRHNETGDFGSHEFHDAKLMRVNEETKEETVLVQSIKGKVPSLNEQFNRTLFKLSFPQQGNRLYFIEVLNNTDAPPSAVYVYDLSSGDFLKLNVSPYFTAYGPSVVSPDGMRVATTIDQNDEGTTRKLFVINLANDTVRMLIAVSGNETLNYCTQECFGGNAGELKWLDDQTVEYKTYDRTKTIPSNFGVLIHPLIATRIVSALINP